jgi:glycerophosphoryl diester phosphodiesterase
MKNYKTVFLFALVFGLFCTTAFTIAPKLHTFRFQSASDVKRFFKYTGKDIPFLSSHRGGPMKGYPENCIATFEHTLQSTHSIIEMDPHYTKDSALVVMHDPTLDRTSNGKGKISNYTLAELRKLKLKDTEGNLTGYGISTLDEMLQWAKGKTLLVIDMKEVSIEARVKKIEENHAENAAIVMAYTFDDAKKCYAMNKNIVMEVMFNSLDKVKEFDATGVPWENVVVFVSHNLPVPKEVIAAIHQKGAMCIIGSSRNYDKDYTASKITQEALHTGYQSIINSGADIIEADLGIEAGLTLQKLRPSKSVKDHFFQ